MKTSSHVTETVSTLCVIVGLLGSGCAAGAEGDPTPSTATCAPSVETPVHTARLAQNGLWQNGTSVNGLWSNGTSVNGIQNNGTSLDGLSASDVELGAVRLDRVDLTADGELVASTAASTLSGDALVGATLRGRLADGQGVEITISSFERQGTLALYGLEHDGSSLCGTGKGLFVPGVWDERGARLDERVVDGERITMTFSCETGAIAKCVVWGYAPSAVGADLHQACTRMVRADYCGTGEAFTKNGTAIDLFDARGIQSPSGDASLLFEAGWSVNGAVCVARTRYDEHTPDGQARLPACWSTLPSCHSLAEASTRGALVANSSRLQSRVVCN